MKLLNKGIYTLLLLLIISTPFACTEDNEDYSIIAGLDFNVATLNANGNKAGVIPTTVPGDGRIVFTVDFGDPANTDNSDVFRTSGPMVSYTYPLESKTYTITVTAAMSGNEDVSITKEHNVVYAVQPPPTSGSPLEGTWKLAPEAGALGVGPGKDNVSWWSNSTADVTTRACLFDDKYVFNADGTFENVLGTESWIEVWQGIAADDCGAPVFPHDGTASATYEYNEAAGTIKLTGKGAYLGLPKAYNLGELTTPGDAPDEIIYEAVLSSDGSTLEIDIKVNDGNDAHWSFKFAKE
jgi:hypothetical protein